MKRFSLFLLGLLGLPLLYALTMVFLRSVVFESVPDTLLKPQHWWFVGGALLMGGLYTWRGSKLQIIYVFGHEMTHAVVGLLFFAKIHRVEISQTGGFVELSKSNLLITLAPYCFPFYFFILVLLRAVIECFISKELIGSAIWNILLGMSLTFHILYTIEALLSVAQPDIHVYGRLFSYWFILCMNLIFFIIALTLIYQIRVSDQFQSLYTLSKEAYTFTGGKLIIPYQWIQKILH